VANVPVVLPAVVAGHAVGQIKAASYEEKTPETPEPQTADLQTPVEVAR
jgi:hypothetical protein